ncbi:MAG: SHOCT-like domain-containing protein [Bdellovibrionota bacterium]
MDEKKKILEMLSNGKITVTEAEALLSAVGAEAASPGPDKKNPKYLRIEVKTQDQGEPQNVNVRVPFNLLRAGVKLVNLMPLSIRTQVQNGLESSGVNLDLSKVNAEDLEQIVEQLADLQVDVEGKDKVKIYVE